MDMTNHAAATLGSTLVIFLLICMPTWALMAFVSGILGRKIPLLISNRAALGTALLTYFGIFIGLRFTNEFPMYPMLVGMMASAVIFAFGFLSRPPSPTEAKKEQ